MWRDILPLCGHNCIACYIDRIARSILLAVHEPAVEGLAVRCLEQAFRKLVVSGDIGHDVHGAAAVTRVKADGPGRYHRNICVRDGGARYHGIIAVYAIFRYGIIDLLTTGILRTVRVLVAPSIRFT